MRTASCPDLNRCQPNLQPARIHTRPSLRQTPALQRHKQSLNVPPRNVSLAHMGVRLRLARFGRRNLPFYRIFAADSRAPRDGRHLEVVGHYNPIPEKDGNKHIGLNIDRIRYWLSVGAQPSSTVGRLLGQAGIIPQPPRPETKLKISKKEAKERAKAAKKS